MKLQAPNGTTGELHLNGRSFDIDKNGQVEVPNNLLGQSVWQQGYTVVPTSPQTASEIVAHLTNEASKPVKQTASDNAGKDKV
jgi:hypothetical protein